MDFPLIDSVIQRKARIAELQARLSQPSAEQQHPKCKIAEASLPQQSDLHANNDQQQLQGVMAELQHIRVWRQERNAAASIINAAAQTWLHARHQQQQRWQRQLLQAKAGRMLVAWKQQVAQRHLVHQELLTLQAAFSAADAWHASAWGFRNRNKQGVLLCAGSRACMVLRRHTTIGSCKAWCC